VAAVGAPVVAVDSRPVDVVVAWVEAGQGCRGAADDVDVPHPGGVGGADGAEDIDDVAPGLDEITRVIAVLLLAPRIPVAIHLVAEADEKGVSPGLGGGCPLPDIGI